MSVVTFPELPLPDETENEAHERLKETRLTHAELETLLNAGVITRNSRIVSGAFVFTGTRVPVYNLWDYLAAGDSLETFLANFPTVPDFLIIRAIELVGSRFTRGALRS